MVSSNYYALVIFRTIIFCVGLVFILSKPFYKLAISAVKQLDILLDRSIGEVEKDQGILTNSFELIKHLLLTTFLLLILLICGILLALFYTIYKTDFISDKLSVYFCLSIFLGSFSLLLFRNKNDYSYWSKLLHTIILDNSNLGKFLFEREIMRFKTDPVLLEKPFVIVTGLARSGTTALTQLLYDEKVFHSISYANVPFLLAPQFWKKIYNPRGREKKERAHGDQVLFSENSIEALEEYFFKVFLNDNYIKENYLVKHEVKEELLAKYYIYQNLFAKRNNTIYLVAPYHSFIMLIFNRICC